MENSTSQILSDFDNDIAILDISNKGIKGILNLEKFSQLEELYCSNNEITKIMNIPNTLKIIYNSDDEVNLLDNLSCVDEIEIKDNMITHLIFKENFNLPINNLPDSLTHLRFYFHSKFNQPINFLPKNLKLLFLGIDFNQPIDFLNSEGFPSSLTILQIGERFNQPINNLPNSLTTLILGSDFNQSIDNLPSSLTRLEITGNFNQPINNLPNSLTHLVLGSEFNQPIENLPNSLIDLEIYGNFNQSVDNLPNSLNVLVLGPEFNQSIDNLPNNLKYLDIGGDYNKLINKLPENLIKFRSGKMIKNISELRVKYPKVIFEYKH
jgi:hypothetical protein